MSAIAGAVMPAHAADPRRTQQWGMDMIEADAARPASIGEGATVAVIDTGARLAHPDLQGRLLPGRDFIDGDDSPDDDNGHGTHIAGIVAANAGNGIGVEGVAPGARVLVMRVLDREGAGTAGNVADAIDAAVDRGADVINLSLGPDTLVPGGAGAGAFGAAVDRALDRGAVVVAAAGNESYPACDQPSGQGRLLCVGAVDRWSNRSYYSNFGQGLGISAPGGAAVGPLEDDILSTWKDDDYQFVAGTSQAAPHVAGVAALLVSLGVRGQAAVERILATARDVGSTGPDGFYGAGIVNARAAVAGLSRPASTAPGTAAPVQAAPLPVSGGSAVRVVVTRLQRLGTVLRWGLRVRCTTSGAGRCVAFATAAGRRIAYGVRTVVPGRQAIVTARLTPAGRALLNAVARRRNPRLRRIAVNQYVSAPGARTQRRPVSLLASLPVPRRR